MVWTLTVAALERVLAACASTAMEPMVCWTAAVRGEGGAPRGRDDVLVRYDDNGNGRITCKEARRHAIAPVRRSHPAYPYTRRRDPTSGTIPPRCRQRSESRWCPQPPCTDNLSQPRHRRPP